MSELSRQRGPKRTKADIDEVAVSDITGAKSSRSAQDQSAMRSIKGLPILD
jgi:hypothetical protein